MLSAENKPIEYEDIQISVPWGILAGRWYGNRNVRPILALHGWQDNLGTWDRLIPLLPRHIGILCIDFPGHGRSTRYPNGITYHTFDNDIIIQRVIKEYNWKKVSLMGHSMGGFSIFSYAALHPHTIDMLIQIDMISTPVVRPKTQIKSLEHFGENLIIENEHLLNERELVSYAYEELEDVLYSASHKSIDKENCKYLLNRGITESKKYPKKFYLTTDSKIKYIQTYPYTYEFNLELAKRIMNINHIVIKTNKSNFIRDDSVDLIKFLHQNNPNFEIHEVVGTHHTHLNSPDAVAQYLIPFILRHRPMSLDTWTVDDKDNANDKDNNMNKYSKL